MARPRLTTEKSVADTVNGCREQDHAPLGLYIRSCLAAFSLLHP